MEVSEFLGYVHFKALLSSSRPIRDIPMPLVSSGVEHGNLRELALARMKDMGTEVSEEGFASIATAS